MVSYNAEGRQYINLITVLILIVVEDGLVLVKDILDSIDLP